MNVVNNLHARQLRGSVDDVGRVVDSLAGPSDQLWPRQWWPAMRLDKSLSLGAHGGHGPIRYRVESYAPGRLVRFRFQAPRGFDGYHEYAVTGISDEVSELRHSLIMTVSGTARLTWPLLFRPLHDALIEDSLSTAAASLGDSPTGSPRWSVRVRLLRWIARRVA